jgi:hypothetical protein
MAWLAVEKFALGVPHHRLEQHLASEGERLDRGTMCRSMEDLGGTLVWREDPVRVTGCDGWSGGWKRLRAFLNAPRAPS